MTIINRIQPKRWHPLFIIFAGGLLVRWLTYYYFYHSLITSGGLHFSPTADEANTYEVLARQLLAGKVLPRHCSHSGLRYSPCSSPWYT